MTIIGILERISDRQAFLTEELSKRKIKTEILLNIKKELIKEWQPREFSSNPSSPQNRITDITLGTINKVSLYDHTFKEDDLKFMLRIGWKLTQFHPGLSYELESDETYLAMKNDLIKLMDSISNDKINNLLTAYLSFSFAMNSGCLLSSYLSTNSKMRKTLHDNIFPNGIQEIRDKGLKSLLSYIQMIIDEGKID